MAEEARRARTEERIAATKLSEEETQFLAAFHPFIGTPRLTGRFLNAYRLLRVQDVQARARENSDSSAQRSGSTGDYRAMVAAEVLPVSRPQDKAGLCWLPDGDEVYARAVRSFTSLDLDPQQVHQSGLDDITALEDEYRDMAAGVLDTTTAFSH